MPKGVILGRQLENQKVVKDENTLLEYDAEPRTLTPYEPPHVTDTPLAAVVDDGASESRDVLGSLPSSSPALKAKRARSETESRGSRVSFISFKGRKRSHTLQEGSSIKENEEQIKEEVSGSTIRILLLTVEQVF